MKQQIVHLKEQERPSLEFHHKENFMHVVQK